MMMNNEAMIRLRKLGNGYPPSSDVIKDPDLSEFNGSHLPELSLWLYFSPENPRENATKFGHWELVGDDQRIDFPIVGRRTTMCFYLGQAPGGERTNCVMLEYKIDRIDPQGSNNLQDSSSLCRIFWENPKPQSGLDGVQDFVYDQLSIMLENEGNPHTVQDPMNSHLVIKESENFQVIKEDESLFGNEWAKYIFDFPDDILNRQDLRDAIKGGDFLHWDDLHDPEPPPNSENSSNVPPMDVQAVLEQILEHDDSSELSGKESTDRKCSVATASNSELVVMKAPVSGVTKEISIPKAKLESLLERLIKIGSKRAAETNQGSKGTAQGGISIGRIAKLWKKVRSPPVTVGVIY